MSAELKVIECEPQGEGVTELLEEMLEKARAGELSSVAVAYVYRCGSTGHGWAKSPSLGTLIGAVARLQHRILNSVDPS